MTAHDDWEARMAAVWDCAADMDGTALVAHVDALAVERPAGDATALFERACARDTAGFEADARDLYSAALATGALDAYRRSRATVQLASTLRILGRLDESQALLEAELARQAQPGAEQALHDEALATLALTFLEQGRAADAAGLALTALAPKLSRYQRSMARNAARWTPEPWRKKG
jgi:hypothetical protein